jgi:hypothetical protein
VRSRLCARVSVCKGVCVQGCRCARLWSQAFEHRCGHPRAKGSHEARPQRQRTLKAERRPLLLRLAATTAISAAISAATVVDVAARTTARPRARLERRLHLQREHEYAQPRRLRRGDLKQRRGAAALCIPTPLAMQRKDAYLSPSAGISGLSASPAALLAQLLSSMGLDTCRR